MMSEKQPLRYSRVGDFVEAFRTVDSKVTLLVGTIGVGLTTACQQVAYQVLRETEASRVLILVPGPLGDYCSKCLSQLGASVTQANRRHIRALQDSKSSEPDAPIWPVGAIIMDTGTAKLPDVMSLIQEAKWDLVVVDHALYLRGLRADLLEDLLQGRGVDRFLFVTLTPDSQLKTRFPQVVEACICPELDLAGVGSHHGDASQRTTSIEFTRSDEETKLIGSLQDLLRKLPSSPAGDATGELALRMAASSLWALETYFTTLLAQRASPYRGSASERLYWDPPARTTSEADTDFWFEPEGLGYSLWDGVPRRAIDALLVELEDVAEERKLSAVWSHIEALLEGETPVRVCVFTDFGSTVEFLERELPGRLEAKSLCTLYPGVTSERVEWMQENGGILVIPTQMSRYVKFRVPIQVIHYDLPGTPAGMTARRSGLAAGSIESVFVDRSHVLQLESRLMQLHGLTRS